jgi:hypothetical protein
MGKTDYVFHIIHVVVRERNGDDAQVTLEITKCQRFGPIVRFPRQSGDDGVAHIPLATNEFVARGSIEKRPESVSGGGDQKSTARRETDDAERFLDGRVFEGHGFVPGPPLEQFDRVAERDRESSAAFWLPRHSSQRGRGEKVIRGRNGVGPRLDLLVGAHFPNTDRAVATR